MWKSFLTILLIGSCLSYKITNSNVLWNEISSYNKETDHKIIFAHRFVQKLHSGFHQSFYTIIFCDFTYFENRIVKYTETYNHGCPVLLISSCPAHDRIRIKPKIDKHGETAYIVSSSELSPILNDYVIEALIRTGVWKPRSIVIFVINVPVEIDSYFYYSMKLHFQLLSSNRITNSVLVVWSNTLKMYIFNPFLDEVKEVTDYNDISHLLAKQYYNLYGTEIRVSVFRKIFLSDETGPVKCDSRLQLTLFKNMNATCKPVPPRDGATTGDLLENGTATGATADLINGYAEMELGSRILKNTFYGYIDTTYPLVQDELCFLVKKAGRQSNFVTVINLMASGVLTVCLINVFVLSSVALLAYRVETDIWKEVRRDTPLETLMALVKCFLRQTLDVKCYSPVFRNVMLMVMLYSLVINSVIDGIITSAVTYPRYRADINTMKELADSNLTLAVHGRNLDLFKSGLSPNYEELLLKPYELFNDRRIKKTIEERDFRYAIMLRKTDAQHVTRRNVNMEDGQPVYHTVLECPIPCFMVYGLEYGSPYLPKMDDFLLRLNQAGILNHWTNTEEYLNYRKTSNLLYAANQERGPLIMRNLREVFIVWLIGLFISTFAFCLELVHRTIRSKLF